MNKQLLTLIMLSILFMLSCESDYNESEILKAKIQINFHDTGFNSSVLLIYNGELTNTVEDSLAVDENHMVEFEIELMQSPDLYILQFSPTESIRLVLSDEETVVIDISELPIAHNYSISGSKDSKLVLKYGKLISQRMSYHDSVYAQYRKYKGHRSHTNIAVITDSLLKKNYYKTYEDLKIMVLENNNSLASLLGIYGKFGKAAILDFDYDYSTFKTLSDSLIKAYPHNSHAISLKIRVNQYSKDLKLAEIRYISLSKGNLFPSITLNTLSNGRVSINESTASRKLVYLWKPNTKGFYDFNKVLLEVNEKYSNDSLEIIAIAFMKDKLEWRNYCRMEKMNWVNMIADANTEDIINPKEEYSLIYLLDKDNNILDRINNIDSLKL